MVKDLLKFYWNRITSPKYILQGKCKKCGRCCRNIVFYAYDKPITDINVYKELKLKNRRMELFYLSGKNEKGELLFTCKSLSEDNKCKYYFLRSLYCRRYPMVKSLSTGQYLTPPEGCGYTILPNKSFQDIIK